jgi:hypothetical protein
MKTSNRCEFILELGADEQFIFNFQHHRTVDDPNPYYVIDSTRSGREYPSICAVDATQTSIN